jgi:hypothetical protein
MDPMLIHQITRIEHARTRPSPILHKEGCRSLLGTLDQGGIWRFGEGEARLQGSLHPRWHSAPSLSDDRWKSHQKEPTDTSHRVRS